MDFDTAVGSLFQPEGRLDPYPAYDVLRAHAPAFPAFENQWFVTTHGLVSRLLRDPGLRVADTSDYDRFWTDWRENRGVASVVLSMLQTNPPDHSRVRRAAATTFTARRVAAMRDVITAQVIDLIEELPARSDFVGDFAYPLPIAVICALLGIPESERRWFRQRAADLTVVLEPISSEEEMKRADKAGRELEAYFTGLIADRRHTPREDLTSALVAASDADDAVLTGEELLANLVLLLVAGFETTTNLLGTGLKILLDHPDQADRLRSDPGLAAAVVEEILRYDSPVQLTSRYTTAPLDLGAGEPLAPGTMLTMLLGAANRDPARYPDPHRFDPDRPNIQPVSFGGGAHYCLGAPLARLEAQIALPLLLTRLPGLALAGAPVRRDRLVLRGYASLPITSGP
ncbi:cytochrome P450 [Actinoplanes awajinensis]|uniref:Cytochrome n=1 Tax=Actinoplanes awajinensis subsp. mycoplanecinus TaxID=135947 RepID=A0A0X3V795_9ACTN|nr:cytochrome P450 [Actinoplanes awajinensis]KUL40102.1 cytochrome [Actinoplanes awajinensis subsp. mycoplanecinus]